MQDQKGAQRECVEQVDPLNLLVGGHPTVLLAFLFSLLLHSTDSCRGTPALAPGAQLWQLRLQ